MAPFLVRGGGGAIVDNAPADEGKPASESAPVETGTAHAILDHSEQAFVADNAFRLSTLNAVLEQLKPLSCDSLIVQVQNALQLEERRSRGRAQTTRAWPGQCCRSGRWSWQTTHTEMHEKLLLGSRTTFA